MASISEIRQQYPQYNDLSDEQLAEGLYNKHYSDMPRDEFNAKIGLSQPEPNMLQKAADAVEPINALGGGIATGLVNAGRAVGGLATDPLPESIQKPLRAAGGAVADALTPAPDSIPGQAMQARPKTAMAGEFIGQVAPYAIPGIGASAGANLGLAGVAGAAQADDGFLNRLGGATLGVATAGAVNLAGKAIQSGISALRSPNLVKEATKYVADKVDDLSASLKGSPREIGAQSVANVYNATRQVDDELFNTFRAAQANVAPEIRTVQRAMEDMLDSLEPNMSGAQRQALKSAIEQSKGATSIADLHDLRKLLAKNGKSFLPQDGEVFASAFRAVKATVDDQMKAAAEKAGVLKEYLGANAHYQEKLLPLINAGSDDVANALSAQGQKVDPVGAAKVLDSWIDKNIKPGNPNTTKAFLNTLDPVGREAVEVRLMEKVAEKVGASTNPGVMFKKELAKYAGTADAILSPQNKKMMDGIVRVLDEAAPITGKFRGNGGVVDTVLKLPVDGLVAITGNKAGQFILRMIGEPSTPRSLVTEFISKGAAMFGGEVGNNVANSLKD